MKSSARALLAAAIPFALIGCGGGSNDGSSASHAAPNGNWGSKLISTGGFPSTLTLTLTLTNSGGHFDFSCSQTADMTQPVQPDSTGHFSVPGTVTFGFVPNRQPEKAQFTGTVTNHVMTVSITVTPPTGPASTDGPYTVIFGQTAPPFQGDCPG